MRQAVDEVDHSPNWTQGRSAHARFGSSFLYCFAPHSSEGAKWGIISKMAEIKIIKDNISLEELKAMARKQFFNIIKAAVDVEQGIISVGGEFHSDLEVQLLEKENSKRENTWGINLLLDRTGNDFIQFDSMINLKPLSGNTNRGVDDPIIRAKIAEIVNKIVKR